MTTQKQDGLSVLAKTLLHAGIATESQCLAATAARADNKKSLLYNLIAFKYIKEPELLEQLSLYLKLSITDLYNYRQSDELIDFIDKSYIIDHHILPISKTEDELTVVTDDPTNLEIFDTLKFKTGLNIKTVLGSPVILDILANELLDDSSRSDATEIIVEQASSSIIATPGDMRYRLRLNYSDDNRSVSLDDLDDESDSESEDLEDLIAKTADDSPEAPPDNWEDTPVASSGFDFDATMVEVSGPVSDQDTPRMGSIDTNDSLVEENTNYVTFPVYYATDRKQDDELAPSYEYFIGKRNALGTVTFGKCSVSIPENHRVGHVERPSWLKLQFSENPDKHMTILEFSIFEQDKFYAEVDSFLFNIDDDSALIFVHGYNVSFSDAILRTAQISYDLDFTGLTACYSWPSTATLKGYLTDANNARWSQPHFKDFINDMRARTGINNIHIIAHSMGSRVLAEALEDVTDEFVSEQVIFAAPDIDADVFRELTEGFHHKVRRITLYASSNDEALKVSRKLQGGYARAGEVTNGVHVYPNVDSIDATHVNTGLLKHSYYGDNRSIVSDIYHLIKQDLPPDMRFGMSEKKNKQGDKYWEFRP